MGTVLLGGGNLTRCSRNIFTPVVWTGGELTNKTLMAIRAVKRKKKCVNLKIQIMEKNIQFTLRIPSSA